ncbi:MAG: sulfite exporter TauE/SafE family protein [Desulfuromonadaceae bacterium]|nr:sulfite exporter TauE/SafE family protein [Desulfuromonadaceae bacterium]
MNEFLFGWQAIALLAVGVVAGFLNVLAGGGSLLTLPVLIFLGVPPVVANGTNRVAILIQNIAAVRSFQQYGALPWRLALHSIVPALVGATIGAKFAVKLDDETFRQVLGGVLVGVLLVMAWDPVRRLKRGGADREPQVGPLWWSAYFGVGLYGGFVQAGVGFLFLILASFCGLDLVRANVLKVLVVLLYIIPTLAIFAWEGKVDWLLGLVMAVGNATGGWLAARMAVKRGHLWIKRVVIVAVLICAVRLWPG